MIKESEFAMKILTAAGVKKLGNYVTQQRREEFEVISCLCLATPLRSVNF